MTGQDHGQSRLLIPHSAAGLVTLWTGAVAVRWRQLATGLSHSIGRSLAHHRPLPMGQPTDSEASRARERQQEHGYA
jgi:hypothetical protein